MKNSIQRRLYTWLFGRLEGEDAFGNRYYSSKDGHRWVMYRGLADATKVPPSWFGWLHFMKESPLAAQQNDFLHQPNLTGTHKAQYYPHAKIPPQRFEDYTSWNPEMK